MSLPNLVKRLVSTVTDCRVRKLQRPFGRDCFLCQALPNAVFKIANRAQALGTEVLGYIVTVLLRESERTLHALARETAWAVMAE